MQSHPKKQIKIKFQNGLSFDTGVKEILSYISDHYELIDSPDPDFIIFGPYGNDIPQKSDRYIRIGYFCENLAPDLSICEWAFGMPLERDIAHPKYKKIQWHNLDPRQLIKVRTEVDSIIASKTMFCNFLYGHHVPYREDFFKALSKYKKVDAAGRSMNNMPSMDSLYEGDVWERKRQYLKPYKFTISFENDSYPGYQTEKLYDAMLANSIPVYYGDPYIYNLFNTKSFINAFDVIRPNYGRVIQTLEKHAQMTFADFRPGVYNSFSDHLTRKLKIVGRDLKMKLELAGKSYQKLVDKIVEIDEDETLYRKMLLEPWFNNNQVPENTSAVERWKEIFG